MPETATNTSFFPDFLFSLVIHQEVDQEHNRLHRRSLAGYRRPVLWSSLGFVSLALIWRPKELRLGGPRLRRPNGPAPGRGALRGKAGSGGGRGEAGRRTKKLGEGWSGLRFFKGMG